MATSSTSASTSEPIGPPSAPGFDVYAVMEPRLPLSAVPAHARRVERLGYSGLLVPEAVHDGFLTALLALEHTSKLRVCTSVVLAFPRSPTTTAYACWDLQALSGGRLELGLGSQVRAHVEGRFGVAWTPPVPRMREYLGALRAVWACWQQRAPLRFVGDHYRLERMPPFFDPGPIEHPSIPLLLGAVGPGLVRLAGEAADGLLTHPTASCPRTLRELTWPRLREGAARANGRGAQPLALLAGGFVATGPDAAAVRAERERIRSYLGFLYSTPQYWAPLELHGWHDVGPRLHRLVEQGRWDETQRLISDEMLARLVPSGTYDEIGDQLRAWYAGLASGLALPLPADPRQDERVRALVTSLRS